MILLRMPENFFSDWLAHKLGNNVSNKVRFLLVGMYHDVSNHDFIAPTIDFKHKHEDSKKYFEVKMEKLNN